MIEWVNESAVPEMDAELIRRLKLNNRGELLRALHVDFVGAEGGLALGPNNAFQMDVPVENLLSLYNNVAEREVVEI